MIGFRQVQLKHAIARQRLDTEGLTLLQQGLNFIKSIAGFLIDGGGGEMGRSYNRNTNRGSSDTESIREGCQS